MKQVETAIAKRLETATKPGSYRTNTDTAVSDTAPKTLKELKILKRKFGITFFVDVGDALAFAKGKGLKVLNRTPYEEDANKDNEFIYEITDKAGKPVGFASGDTKGGEAYIAPTTMHYNRWMNYARSQDNR